MDGQGWMVAKDGERVETDNPPDHYNTMLKIAKKRALVDAVLTTTAASDSFTQDLDDISTRLAALNPPVAQMPVTNTATPMVEAIPSEPSIPTPASKTEEPAEETVDFRRTEVPFGKNRGMVLADLTPQQIHWYECEWMPKKEALGGGSISDQRLIRGLKAYRAWRETEKQETTPTPRATKKRHRTTATMAA